MYADRQDAEPNAVNGRVDDQLVDLAVEVFSMLAESTRVRIVLSLQAGELPVNAIAAAVGKAPAAVSQHLAKLRLARIVAARQDGNRVFYRLENGHASQLVTDAIHQAEHAIGQPLHHRMESTHRP
ncbi:MAG TPA: metalloregulator ArsR/SmtB family transcription factor [Microlunatus sp.]